ncbi:MAG: hypothetical protein ACRDJG_07760 [Actinomycetota bacterium]
MRARSVRGTAQPVKRTPLGSTFFNLGGGLVLGLTDPGEEVVARLMQHMDPYPASDAVDSSPAVLLDPDRGPGERRFSEILNPARDGTVTALLGGQHHLLLDGRSCSLPSLDGSLPFIFGYECGFPLERIVGPVIRPAMQVALVRLGALAVHGSAVAIDGKGVVVAGWSETGKTETALALAERGAPFISDKWTVVGSDRMLTPFPISVGIRRWVLAYLPLLRSCLPRRARAQFFLAAASSTLSRPALAAIRGGAPGAGEWLRRSAALAERAALRPSKVISIYGRESLPTVRLGALALLMTVPDITVSAQPADPAWAARRLAASAAYERRDFFALYERGHYGHPESRADMAAQVRDEEDRLLRGTLSGIPVLVVRSPFPTDPGHVGDAIARHL